jgi:predicted phage-related endonuclease
MNNQRYTVMASSLGSYFGVGFNTPSEQLNIDLGVVPNDFDDDAERRMRLGRMLENGILDYFEEEFGSPITNRNTETLDGFNGMLRVKLDGEMLYNGEDTVVEAKISNSSYEVFTLSKGYYLQCQAYMAVKGYRQALLLGLYQGKPIYRLIYRDEDVISDIRKMVEAVWGILNGITSIEDYPTDILRKYAKGTEHGDLDEFDDNDVNTVLEIQALTEAIRPLVDRQDDLKDELRTKYNNVEFDCPTFKFSVKMVGRKGGFDEAYFMQEHPDIDLDKYRKAGSESKMLNIRVKKTLG